MQEYKDMCFHPFLYTLQATDLIVPHQACMTEREDEEVVLIDMGADVSDEGI
jgi:hypothetical protein